VSPRSKTAAKRQVDTPTELLRAAERLFAARGVDSVSLREIAAAAGQANHSAALYHFSNKRELINALLTRHSEPIQAAWLVTLDHLAASGHESLEALVALMVRSLIAQLDDPDGGADYLMIVAQLVPSRSFPITSFEATTAPGIIALSLAMMRHIGEIPFYLVHLRMMRVAAVLYCSIANYQTVLAAGADIEREVFIKDLISSIVAVLRS
jgi:AcrR family transcriptional regulator